MTRAFALWAAVVGLALTACDSNALATTYVVTANPDLTFTPSSITIRQGDKINFQNAGGLHNVIADNGSFHCGVNCNTNSAPSDRPWSYTITFNNKGSFGYYCEQHGNLSTGMRGTVIVIDTVFFNGFDGAPSAAGTQP